MSMCCFTARSMKVFVSRYEVGHSMTVEDALGLVERTCSLHQQQAATRHRSSSSPLIIATAATIINISNPPNQSTNQPSSQ